MFRFPPVSENHYFEYIYSFTFELCPPAVHGLIILLSFCNLY